jgi:hypothetical protein
LYLSHFHCVTTMYRMPYLSLSAHSPIFPETNKHTDTNRKIAKKRVCSFRPCSFSKPSTRLHRTNPHALHYHLSLSHTIKQSNNQSAKPDPCAPTQNSFPIQMAISENNFLLIFVCITLLRRTQRPYTVLTHIQRNHSITARHAIPIVNVLILRILRILLSSRR